MNYINRGKRDVLIFPKFKNVDKLQEIREKYDELANILPPHITLIFPFKDNITNKMLKQRLKQVVNGIKPFRIKCGGITFYEDINIGKYYIFLNVVDQNNEIRNLHNKIYEKILFKEKRKEYNYIPHITLGTVDMIDNTINLDDEFETIVDEFAVESIGEGEVSNIEFKVSLNG